MTSSSDWCIIQRGHESRDIQRPTSLEIGQMLLEIHTHSSVTPVLFIEQEKTAKRITTTDGYWCSFILSLTSFKGAALDSERRSYAMRMSIRFWYVCPFVRTTVSIDSLGSSTWAFQRTHYWTSKIEDGGDPPSWNREIVISQRKIIRFWRERAIIVYCN